MFICTGVKCAGNEEDFSDWRGYTTVGFCNGKRWFSTAEL